MKPALEVERVRVVHFLPWLAGGGTEIGCRELVRGLPAARYEQRMVCFETRGQRRDDFEALGVPVTVLGGKVNIRNLSGLAKLVGVLRAWKPHVLHASVFEGQVLGTLAGLLAGVPVIVTEEATCPAPPRDRSRTTRLLLRQLLLRNDAVVAIAPTVKRYLVDKNRIPEPLVKVIPYGVREPRRPSDAELARERTGLGIPGSALVIGTVCRLHDGHKRVSDLIVALARLRSAPNARLLIVGDGPDRQALESLSRELHVAERVHWAGYRADPASCFHLMDVFALTSALEGFGIVFAEAAFCGLPCIGTAVGGIVDAIEPGVTGILVPAGDVDAIVGAMERLIGDPALRLRMGDAGRERAARLHAVDAYASTFDALFLGALERRGIVTVE